MKRIFILIAGAVLMAPVVKAGEDAPAVLERKDGKALRVFLQSCESGLLTVRLDKAAKDMQMNTEDVNRLQFSYAAYDEKAVQQLFNQADYAGVTAVLEPVTAPYRNYVSISNNLETAFCLLMNAYLESGNYAQARDLSVRLMANRNPSVQILAQVGLALSAIGGSDLSAAGEMLPKIQNPAAQLYVQACIERAEKQPKTAIQTAVKLIAEHPNDMNWMPQTELLCAELYDEMGMTNSAVATARQTQKLYAGTNIEKEAQALSSKIEKANAKPE